MDLILKHEKVHARDWHSIDLLLTHLYRAVFWINPLAWMIKRQVGENLEFIADATSIPILVDGDTGWGNFNNLRRAVQKLGQRGIAGICVEDKLFP